MRINVKRGIASFKLHGFWLFISASTSGDVDFEQLLINTCVVTLVNRQWYD